MSDSIIERLRHHAQDERNTAFARSTMREAEGDIERLERKLEQEQITNARATSGLADAVLKLRAELAASQAECDRLRGTSCEWETEVERLRRAIEIVRQHPSFDAGGPMVEMMDAVIAGEKSTLLDYVESFNTAIAGKGE